MGFWRSVGRVARVVPDLLRGRRSLRAARRGPWARLLETSWVWVVLLSTIGLWGITPGGFLPLPSEHVGQVASRDYFAPADLLIPDEETTAEKQERARNEVPPVYDYDPGVGRRADERLATLFQVGRQLLESSPDALPVRPEMVADLQASTGLTLEPAGVAALATHLFAPDLEDRLRTLATRSLRRGVVDVKPRLLENTLRGISLRNVETGDERLDLDLYARLDYPEELAELLDAEMSDWRDLSTGQRGALVELLIANMSPNLSPNRSETVARQEAAARRTPPVFKQVTKGQVIVRQGDQIDASTARVIAEVTGRRRFADRILPLAGSLALLLFGALALWLGLAGERVSDHSRDRLFNESLLLLLIGLLGSKFCFVVATALAGAFEAAPFDSFRSYAYGVPFAALALVAMLLFGRQTALLVAFVFSLLVHRLAGPDALWVTLFSVVGSLGAIYAAERFQVKQRLAMMRLGLVVGLLNVASVLVLIAIGSDAVDRPIQLVFDLVCAFAGGFVVAAAASFAVPILESLLNLTTDIKLIELANTNLPLLRRLAFEAPGTFQHSLMVANLAKEGCEVIGADPVLAYTGGLYHDIGKMLRPEYFIENQRPGQNRHDKLQPSMSSLIVISHVKDGLALAREHHLPKPILDAIAQHHGTRLISYFYNRAQERAGERGEVTQEKYRYPGPRPQNKVMGVLMLADGIEAASRTLNEPTPLKLRTLVDKIVEDCLAEGQLDESDMTLADIRKVSEAFVRVLSTIFHQRIDYPGFDFNAEAAERPPRVEAPPPEAARAS